MTGDFRLELSLRDHAMALEWRSKSGSFQSPRGYVVPWNRGSIWDFYNCLVVFLEHDWNMFPYWEVHHPNSRTHIFQRGRLSTTKQYKVLPSLSDGCLPWSHVVELRVSQPGGPPGSLQGIHGFTFWYPHHIPEMLVIWKCSFQSSLLHWNSTLYMIYIYIYIV